MKLSKLGQSLEDKGFVINFKALPEHILFSEQMSECMSPQEIEEYAGEWFCAEVSISLEDVHSDSEYLGGCAYDEFDDFTGADNDYFDDMLNACVTDLKNKYNLVRKFIESKEYQNIMESL